MCNHTIFLLPSNAISYVLEIRTNWSFESFLGSWKRERERRRSIVIAGPWHEIIYSSWFRTRGWSLSRVTPVNMECGRPEAIRPGAGRERDGTYVESVAVFGQAVERADGRGTPGPTNSTIRYYNPGNGNVPPAQVQRSDSATYQPRCAPSFSLPLSLSLSSLLFHRWPSTDIRTPLPPAFSSLFDRSGVSLRPGRGQLYLIGLIINHR